MSSIEMSQQAWMVSIAVHHVVQQRLAASVQSKGCLPAWIYIVLHCIADRMEDNAGSMPVLELPPADIRNLEQIAKVSQPGVFTT